MILLILLCGAYGNQRKTYYIYLIFTQLTQKDSVRMYTLSTQQREQPQFI